MADNFTNALNVLDTDVLLAPAAGFIITDLSSADADTHTFSVPDYYLDADNKLSFKVFFTNGWNKVFNVNVSETGAKSIKYYKNGTKVDIESKGDIGTVLEMFWDGEDFVISANSLGGGSGTGGMEISEEDYEALPEEEKNNGTTYFIPDAESVDVKTIDDNVTSEDTTWSSQKISSLSGIINKTTAEYEALPEEEKHNGKVYNLTDAEGGFVAVSDAVEDGNMNAVTSNAVNGALTEQKTWTQVQRDSDGWFRFPSGYNEVTAMITGNVYSAYDTILGTFPKPMLELFGESTTTYFRSGYMGINDKLGATIKVNKNGILLDSVVLDGGIHTDDFTLWVWAR